MNFTTHTLGTTAVVLSLCGCGGTATPPEVAGSSMAARAPVPLQLANERLLGVPEAPAPKGVKPGLYTIGKSFVNGFPANNQGNGPPFCSELANGNVDIAFDAHGRLIVPDAVHGKISIYGAPTRKSACGKLLGVIDDSNGGPTDAASFDALKGRIVVVNASGLAICSLRNGCSKSFTGPYANANVGVALAKDGDCWMESDAASGPGVLDYFKGCKPPGQLALGFYGGGDNWGGLDIDKFGNIVSIFYDYPAASPALYVYSGCRPACTTISGPLPLIGAGVFGHLNGKSTEFALADGQYSQVDVYAYTPTSLTYKYSFTDGLSGIAGVAYNPKAEQ